MDDLQWIDERTQEPREVDSVGHGIGGISNTN